eukprot:SAG22_NODE_2981_length_2054_cov_1.827621_3_plen_288_part_01
MPFVAVHPSFRCCGRGLSGEETVAILTILVGQVRTVKCAVFSRASTTVELCSLRRCLSLPAVCLPVLVGQLGCMTCQLNFLNGAMRRFDVLYVLPVYQSFWITGATVNGMLFFHEYANFGEQQWVLFPVGVACTVSGIAALTSKFKQSGSARAPLPVDGDDGGGGGGDRKEGAADEERRRPTTAPDEPDDEEPASSSPSSSSSSAVAANSVLSASVDNTLSASPARAAPAARRGQPGLGGGGDDGAAAATEVMPSFWPVASPKGVGGGGGGSDDDGEDGRMRLPPLAE